MLYLQRLKDGIRETVDDASTYKEAKVLLAEFKMSEAGALYYISKRACKNWIKGG